MDEAARLEAEYCPPIDPALLFAITSDFDLDTSEGFAQAKDTLEQLKDSAVAEEDEVNFDPSGTGNHDASSLHLRLDNSTLDNDVYSTAATDDTSLSGGVNAIRLDNDDGRDASLECLDDETKLLLLIDVFGDQVNEETIKTALDGCNGNWNAAMEELLNQVYFTDAESHDQQQQHQRPAFKGIDGFAEEQVSRKTKRKRNRARRVSGSTDSSASETSVATPSKWQVAKNDVDFISSRTGIASTAVRLAYNQNGASVRFTINALLKEEMKHHKSADDADTIRLAKELAEDFPLIARPYLHSLIRISHSSMASAHELAQALVAQPTHKAGSIIPQYIRVSDEDIEGTSWQKPAARKPLGSATSSTLGAESYAVARAQAFAQASAAHRKAKSDRFMGGAAAYYSQLGRDYSSLSHSATASAADALANTQSSASQVDLHGVDVLNAVRIAREKVEQWYSGLGEDRANGRVGASHRNNGFRIVVGLGRHSEGGKGKLGPAVTKMLRSEGWKFENEGAAIAVKGRQKP